MLRGTGTPACAEIAPSAFAHSQEWLCQGSFSPVVPPDSAALKILWSAALAAATTDVVEFWSQQMAPAREFPIAPGKKLGAWVCLLAAILLWSPLWAAAWQSNAMNCCADGMCPIHAHANQSSQNNMPKQSTPCDHHSGLHLMQCSLSCCHAKIHSFVAAIVFVLPASPTSSRLPLFVTPRSFDSAREILPAVAPPDLPPRFFHL